MVKDNLDIAELFEGLDEQQARQVLGAMYDKAQAIRQPKGDNKMTFNLQELFAGLDDDEIARVLQGMTTEEQTELYRSLTKKVDPRFAPPTNEEKLESNAKVLKYMYKERSKYRDQIAAIELENDAIWHSQDATARAAKEAEQPDAQIAQLESKRDALYEEWGRYAKFPSKYKARMQQITEEAKKIEQRIVEMKA
jgi:Mg/Co/Ni transporter MgtE